MQWKIGLLVTDTNNSPNPIPAGRDMLNTTVNKVNDQSFVLPNECATMARNEKDSTNLWATNTIRIINSLYLKLQLKSCAPFHFAQCQTQNQQRKNAEIGKTLLSGLNQQALN